LKRSAAFSPLRGSTRLPHWALKRRERRAPDILNALSLFLTLFVAGCASPGKTPSWVRTGDPIVDGRTAIAQGPAKDKVLWQYRTALEALRRGQFNEAKALFDDALLTIGSISAGDKEAKKSRGYFSEEARKTFRGEPYERAMAYFYRGILYWMDGEPDNARACFRNAQFQDSDTESKEYAGDYMLLDYLDGFATVKLSGDGSDAFKRAEALSKAVKPSPYNANANTLFFLEFGTGPSKYATGEYREQLRARTVQSAVRSARIKTGDQVTAAGAYDDLNFQATTRGGRIMDYVLENKAVFKAATDTVGDVALIGGVVAASNRRSQDVGLGLIAAGLLSKIVSAATTPAADTRAWDNLPQYLSFAAVQLPPGQHTAVVEFLNEQQQPIAALTKTITINVVETRDTVVFVSDRSPTTKNL
jgi:tetratricopeptide (TPR) repeat protein